MRHRNALSGAAGTSRLPTPGAGQRWSLVLAVLGTAVLGGCASPAEGPGRAVLAGEDVSSSAAGEPATPQIDPAPNNGQTPSGGRPWDATATAACEDAVGQGFTEVAQSPDESGVTTFWTRGRHWVACDVPAGGEATPTILEPAPGSRAGFDERSLAVSTVTVEGAAAQEVRVVAAGRLPWPVQEIGYTFPDGHTEQARFVSSEGSSDETWWALAYTPTEGALTVPDAATTALGPVTISIVGGAAEAFRVEWEDLQRSE
jgi:hypothetical protein